MYSYVFNTHYVVVVGMTISLLNLGVSSLSLTCTPTHVQINRDLQNVTVVCQSELPLTSCQFQFVDFQSTSRGPHDLSRGRESVADSKHLTPYMTGYSYSGLGLESGSCGITVTTVRAPSEVVGCRVKTQRGGWTYAWMEIDSSSKYLPLSTTVPEREVVVKPDHDARVMVRSARPLAFSRVLTPSTADNYLEVPIRPHSAGANDTEVVASITRAGEDDNGPYLAYLKSTDDRTPRVSYRYIAVVVAKPPTDPLLSVSYEGADMTASCAAEDSRPVAQITWRLGDDVIRQDSTDDSATTPYDEWSWPWDKKSIRQTIKRTMRPEDQGKMLKCVVSHVALGKSIEASRQVSFVEPKNPANYKTVSCAAQADAQEALANAAAAQARAQIAELELKSARARNRAAEAYASNLAEDLRLDRAMRIKTVTHAGVGHLCD